MDLARRLRPLARGKDKKSSRPFSFTQYLCTRRRIFLRFNILGVSFGDIFRRDSFRKLVNVHVERHMI